MQTLIGIGQLTKHISTVLALSSALTLLTTSAVAKAPADHRFTPVIVLSTDGDANVNDAVYKQILESVSGHLRRAVLTIYAEEIYGSGAAFKKRTQRSGVLGIMGRAFQSFDQQMQDDIKSGALGNALAQASPTGKRATLEVYWVKAPHGLPVLRDKITGAAPMAMLWNLAQSTILPDSTNVAEEVMSSISDIAVVNESDLAGGRPALLDQGRAALDWLIEGNQEVFLPLYSSFAISASKGKIDIDMVVTVKPGALNIALPAAKGFTAVESKEILFQPPHYVADPTIGRVSFNRSYSRGGTTKPYLTMTWGRMVGNDPRAVATCLMACAELEPNGNPKHMIRSAPTLQAKVGLPNAVQAYAAERLMKLSGRRMPSSIESVDLFIMLQQLTFDLSSPTGLTIEPSKTRIPLVVRLTDETGNRFYVDVTQNRFGIDIIAKIAIDKVGAKISQQAQDGVSLADEAANARFAEIAKSAGTILQ